MLEQQEKQVLMDLKKVIDSLKIPMIMVGEQDYYLLIYDGQSEI